MSHDPYNDPTISAKQLAEVMQRITANILRLVDSRAIDLPTAHCTIAALQSSMAQLGCLELIKEKIFSELGITEEYAQRVVDDMYDDMERRAPTESDYEQMLLDMPDDATEN